MCGFAAIIAFNDNAPELDRVESMGQQLVHRGPDDKGLYKGRRAALAFRRLAILDTSISAHQPMLSADGNYVMVFNGEIFNYIELRQELELAGWQFKSTGDSEVLLTSYLAWGEACLQKLNGMYAFAILNLKDGSAFVARDRAGIKPLFYARTEKAIFIASEVKAIAIATGAELNQQRLSKYLCAGRTDSMHASSDTYFKGIFSLEAAFAISISHDGAIRRWRHWDTPSESGGLARLADSSLINNYRDLFTKAVSRQMRSDVPIGITLSGGVDSASVACVAQNYLIAHDSKPLTYFCFHSQKYDESRYRDEVVARCKGTTVKIEKLLQSVVSLNRSLIEIHDEPLHSATALANAELYRAAQAQGIKVLMGGQGADELLAGYTNYRDIMLREIGASGGWLRAVGELRGNGWVADEKRMQRILDITQQLTTRKLRSLGIIAKRNSPQKAAPDIKEEAWITTRARNMNAGHSSAISDLKDWSLWASLKDSFQQSPMPDYLRIEDRNSMAFGIEARVPFLDNDLVDFSFALPSRLKVHGGVTKYIHKAAMRGIVPDSILDRSEKYGFPVDKLDLFSPEAIRECLATIHDGPLQKLDLINFKALNHEVARTDSTKGLDVLFTALQGTLLAEHALSIKSCALADENLLTDEIINDSFHQERSGIHNLTQSPTDRAPRWESTANSASLESEQPSR